MFIDSLTLNNFRIYKGVHKIVFPHFSNKNICVVSGENGYGKTTFLTSLVWCLYGKQMSDVDDKFKKEISDLFGYKNFAISNLNRSLQKQTASIQVVESEKKRIIKNGYSINNTIDKQLIEKNQYSVSVVFSDLFIPSFPCESITISRTYDVFRDNESVQILIDGKENELTKQVGSEIFINDFILSKDIAKFFFFDSEKIVSLAEMKSVEDKRRLSTAYSEVLGVKKYEDLRNNLENLRIKFRKKSNDLAERDKLNNLIKEKCDLDKLIGLNKTKIENNDKEILNKRMIAEQYQENLIREGNSISVSELIKLKNLRDDIKTKDSLLNNKLKDLLDLAPFAIAGKKFSDAYKQMLLEQKDSQKELLSANISKLLCEIQTDIIGKLNKIKLNESSLKNVSEIITSNFEKYVIVDQSSVLKNKTLLDFTVTEQNEFQSIFENIKFSYSLVFKELIKNIRVNKSILIKTIRKISQAEASDQVPLIKEIRNAKTKIEKQILDLEKENRKISEDNGSLQKESSTKTKLIAELSKKVSVDESDKQKDEIAERLISELNDFLFKLKLEKKSSLESNILHELKLLMHKSDFITKVKVDISNDIIDIHLFDSDNQEINKDKLSKGEQQLYATAILKALVNESEVKFPIFIDSPLQKFDLQHSNKIIKEFYPNISDQVLVFPLLGKELSEIEYKALLPSVSSSFIIINNSNYSFFQEVNPNELFEKIKEYYVYPY